MFGSWSCWCGALVVRLIRTGVACSSPDSFVFTCGWWPAGCVSGAGCWLGCCGTRHRGGVSVFIVLIGDVLGVPCSSLDLFTFVWMLGSCGWWRVGCVSGTGVGPFVVVLNAGVGGVSVFVILFVLVQRVGARVVLVCWQGCPRLYLGPTRSRGKRIRINSDPCPGDLLNFENSEKKL
jgi:hypothetical protein